MERRSDKAGRSRACGVASTPFDTVVERALAQINQLTRDGLLRAHIDKVFAFEDVVAAHRHLESGDCRGRVVLKV